MNIRFFTVNGQNINVIDHVLFKFEIFNFHLWHLDAERLMILDGEDYLLCSKVGDDFVPRGKDFELYSNGTDSYGIRTTMSIFREDKNKFLVEIDQANFISKYMGEKVIPQKIE